MPPQWSILKPTQALDNLTLKAPSRETDSVRTIRDGSSVSTNLHEHSLNEPGIMYVSGSEQRLDSSMKRYGNSASALLDTLAYSMDTLPIPPGTGSATSAGDAFPMAPPLSSGKNAQQQKQRPQPPSVSALRDLDAPSKSANHTQSVLSSASGIGAASIKTGPVVTGGGMKIYRNDLFERNMEVRGYSDADAGGEPSNEYHPTHNPSSNRRLSDTDKQIHDYHEADLLADGHESQRTLSKGSSRELIIKERGKQHARDMWREKHVIPPDTDRALGTQSATTERKPVDVYDDNNTVVTAHSGVSYRSAFPASVGPVDVAPASVDSRTARRDRKKGDLIEISFADTNVDIGVGAGGGRGASSNAPGSVTSNGDTDEERRRAKFEMMRKKKMEEAAEREKVLSIL